jgi:localization factor PodJL
MKSNVPWSIKGIDPDARVVAKKAAKEAGMTLGEWLNHQIRVAGNEEQPDQQAANDKKEPEAELPENVQAIPSNVVTVDQLREMVYSLNRLNERLKTAERDSRQALTGLNQGLSTAMDRLRKVEAEREASTDNALKERVDELEKNKNSRDQIDNLLSLEQALTKMVDQFDQAQKDTVARVDAHEKAIGNLDQKVAMMDTQMAASLAQVRDDVDTVSSQLQQTEKTARAVMLEARAASQSTDEEFIERTGNKLRILGTEIKRSGDQIQTLEKHITQLSDRIEGAEERSAQGISKVSEAIASLRNELGNFDHQSADNTQAAQGALTEAARDADDRISSLQTSFDKMINRLEGVADRQTEAPTETMAALSDPQPVQSKAPTNELSEALEAATPDAPGEEDFDAVFDDPVELLDEAESAIPAEDGAPQLTPKQKVLLAARARRKRQEEQAEAEARAAAEAEEEAPQTEEEAAPPPMFDDQAILDQIARNMEGGGDDSEKEGRLSRLRAKYGNRSEGNKLPIIPLALLGTVLIVALAWFLLKDSFSGGDATSANIPPTPAVTNGTPGTEQPAGPATSSPAQEFERWKLISANATTPEEQARALDTLKRAARRNHPPAQFALGKAYEDGTAGEPRPGLAQNWYEAAAERGNIDAMYELGKIASGTDLFTSITWFEQAAAYGNVDAIYNLALIYDPTVDLDGVVAGAKDASQSYYWYKLAEKLGDPAAASDVQAVSGMVTPEQRSDADQRVAVWNPQQPIPDAN